VQQNERTLFDSITLNVSSTLRLWEWEVTHTFKYIMSIGGYNNLFPIIV